jgi:hypothetical protein
LAAGLCEKPFGHPEDRRSVAHGAGPRELAGPSLKKLEPVRGEAALILRRLLCELRSQSCTLAKLKSPRCRLNGGSAMVDGSHHTAPREQDQALEAYLERSTREVESRPDLSGLLHGNERGS